MRLVLDEGKTVGAAARDLDLTESALREWVKRARADRTQGRTGLTTAEREELARLRKENRELRTERDILKKAAAFFAKHSRKVRLDRGGEGRVHRGRVLSVLRVSPSGFYAWQQRPESARAQRDRQLRVHGARVARRPVAGARAPAGLRRTCRRPASASVEKRVARLMREDGLQARVRKRFRSTTMSDHDQPIAANVLDRQFDAERAQSAVGRRHDGVRHRQQRQAVSRGHPRSVLAVHRGLGAQRRE